MQQCYVTGLHNTHEGKQYLPQDTRDWLVIL